MANESGITERQEGNFRTFLAKRLSEQAGMLFDAVGSLPRHVGVLLLIVVVVTGYQLLPAERVEQISMPLLNGVMAATVYHFVVGMFWVASGLGGRVEAGRVKGAAATCQLEKAEPVDAKELYRYAVHEAGHLLSIALFPKKPTWVYGYVRPYAACPNGHVSFELEGPRDAEISWAHMLNALAGQVAEEVIFGTLKSGSASDNGGWEREAKAHMAAGFAPGQAWFITPESEGEARVNAAALKVMRDAQTERLRRFLETNKAVLKEVAEAFVIGGEIKTAEALGALERVEVV